MHEGEIQKELQNLRAAGKETPEDVERNEKVPGNEGEREREVEEKIKRMRETGK